MTFWARASKRHLHFLLASHIAIPPPFLPCLLKYKYDTVVTNDTSKLIAADCRLLVLYEIPTVVANTMKSSI